MQPVFRVIQFNAHCLLQDSTSSGDNEKRLETESSNDMRGIEKSIKEKKQQVCDCSGIW